MKSSGILAVCSGMFALKSREDDGLQCCVVVVCIVFLLEAVCDKLLLNEAET